MLSTLVVEEQKANPGHRVRDFCAVVVLGFGSKSYVAAHPVKVGSYIAC
jgi:hypothetical protein